MENKKRLIDANEAIEKINCLCVDNNENWIGTDNQSFVDNADVIDILSDMPTVDAVAVVHGRWVMKETMIRNPFAKNAYCSVCLEETSYAHNYCPNCGAKMDGDGNG